MVANQTLVLAFFQDEDAADTAARSIAAWARSRKQARLGSVGVLVQDENGHVKSHKLGPRESRNGAGIGFVLGAVAAVASGGLTFVEGVAIGGAGGGVWGPFFTRASG